MRKLIIAAALATTALASPALGRDGSPYVGIEGGAMKVEDTSLDFEQGDDVVNNAFGLDFKTGYDVDLIAGYDFGGLRVEAEFGYKRVSLDQVSVDPALFGTSDDFDSRGRTRVLSVMGNLLLDFGADTELNGFVGGGVGVARTKLRSDLSGSGVPLGSGFNGSDADFAWQVVAGVRLPVSDAIDLGLKYRFFNTDFALADDDEPDRQSIDGRFRSHSLLASLIFNFGARVSVPTPPPPPPPPAPPPPPSTQTCPDGSLVLASESCPLPPTPPPPPPPAPERG